MKYLKEAHKIAIENRNKNDGKNHHFGCIAIRSDGSVVSGRNIRARDETSSAHAEVRTLLKAGKNCRELYVTRALAKGKLGMAKPCMTCMSIIKNFKVKKVYYSINDAEFGIIKL